MLVCNQSVVLNQCSKILILHVKAPLHVLSSSSWKKIWTLRSPTSHLATCFLPSWGGRTTSWERFGEQRGSHFYPELELWRREDLCVWWPEIAPKFPFLYPVSTLKWEESVSNLPWLPLGLPTHLSVCAFPSLLLLDLGGAHCLYPYSFADVLI